MDDWMAEKHKELSEIENETFHEASESRLLQDEREWENERATIPTSEPLPKKPEPLKSKNETRSVADFSCFSAYLSPTNVSIDNWNKRSDNLMDMLTQKSPPRRAPIPLVNIANDSRSYSQRYRHNESMINEDKENSNLPSLSSIPKMLCKYRNKGYSVT